jgi:endonuclease/exonuclease/phosphatase family metal-dependent hydrolase
MTPCILEMNIHGGHNAAEDEVLEDQATFIRGFNPDIATLQEVLSASPATHGLDQAAELSTKTGLLYYASDDLGNAILSRYPLSDTQKYIVPRPVVWPPIDPTTAMSGFVAVTVEIDKHPYRVFSTHFNSRYDSYRRVQGQDLGDRVHSLWPSVGVIVGGDFNGDPSDPNYAPMRDWMTEAFDMLNAGAVNAPTIDQVWIGKSVALHVDSYDNPPALDVTDHESITVVTLSRVVAPPPPSHLLVTVSPTPLVLPAGTKGVARATFSAADSSSGTSVPGSVTLDASGVGGQVTTAATGTVMDVYFIRNRHVDPVTHEVEFTFTMPTGVVSAAGYDAVNVDWDI